MNDNVLKGQKKTETFHNILAPAGITGFTSIGFSIKKHVTFKREKKYELLFESVEQFRNIQ